MSLDELQEQIERIYIDMENELLLNIAKKLSQSKPMEIDKWDSENNQPLYGSGGVNEWQLQRLKELGGLTEENAKIIAKYSGRTVEEVNRVFERAREIGITRDETIIQEGVRLGILNEIAPVAEDLAVKGILGNAIESVLTTFNTQNNSLLASAGQEYTNIVNRVSSQVLAGTKTTNKAMQEAVSQLAQKGLTGFTARNGAKWSPEAYTKMVIRSNTQNTINRIQDQRIRSCGGNYIEVSSHLGARPLCSQDQGQIFSLNDDTTPIEDLYGNKIKVRAWSSSTNGKPAGIFGINCGHSRYMFIPNFSVQREMDFTKKENDDAYIEKQQQRLYERTIRNKKREIAMLKQTGAEDSYIRRKQNSLSDTRKEYFNFLDKTGRTRITANEWIGSTTLTKGLSSSNRNTFSNHPKPKLLEELSNVNEINANKVLKKYEKIIKNDIIENAIVITKEGKVYQCFGNKTNVWPDVDLGDEIIGSSITHNHPKTETNYSFSNADINLFEKYKLSKLRGIDDKYIYELDRTKNPSLSNPSFNDNLEDITLEHLRLIQYAIDNNISYRRWKND